MYHLHLKRPNIFRLKQLNHFEQIAITKHANERLKERKITADDIVNCISTGEIIKQYEDDKPLPSCLILGKSCNGKPLHIVVSNDDNFIYLITAYYPDFLSDSFLFSEQYCRTLQNLPA